MSLYLSLVCTPTPEGPAFVLNSLESDSGTVRSVGGLCASIAPTYADAFTWVNTNWPELSVNALVKSDVAFHIGNMPVLAPSGRMRLNWVI